MKKYIFLCAAFGLFSGFAFSQSINLNDGWEFLRLTQEQSHEAIKNQGTDWSSQYSVQHVNAADKALAVPENVLNGELRTIAQGRWEQVRLPHTPNIEPLVVLHQWQGICYYRKKLNVDARDEGKQLWLEFEGAMQLADVWINGQHVAQHAGGFTPFVIDATALLHAGRANEILVRLDNRDNPLIPPGKPLGDLDFSFYGGLYRDVKLIVKNPVHITNAIMAGEQAGGGIFVTYPEVSAEQATVCVKTQLANKTAAGQTVTLRQTLYEWRKGKGAGKKVAETEMAVDLSSGSALDQKQNLHVSAPKLWYPDAPCLYVLRTEVLQGKESLDSEDTRIGIRRIEMTRERGFVINGKPYRLEGTNRHQEYPYVGYALSNQAHYRDMYQIRNSGYNIVRLGHYPQAPAVLDACDELGLMAIEPIPGWQFYNKAKTFTDHTYQDVRDLIRRDRNHPSVIMWETTLNESWPPTAWKDQAIKTAHEEYPGDQCYTSGDAYGYDGFDVCYNDWEEGFNRPNKTRKPGFIREYYDYEFGGHYSTTRVARGDGDRALVQNAWNAQWSHNRYRAYYPWTMGEAVWSMYDYNRGCCDNICYSGVADIFRLPKFSLHYFRTQVPAGSYTPAGKMPYEVSVCSHWMKSASDTLQVYGNVDEVELQLNGRVVARRHPDTGATTLAYVSRPDGGNATNISFPPFTFFGVKWEKGTLKAVGYKQGRKVAEQAVTTPGEVSALAVDYFKSGMPASQNDLLLVYVKLQDSNGTLCFGENAREVKITQVEGGELRSPACVKAEAGVATFVVATGKAKELRIHASSDGLNTSKALKLSAVPQPAR